MTYIGIDPGKRGALAIIREDGGIETYSYDPILYRNILSGFDPGNYMGYARCCLEHVSAMPGNGSVSMFSFGENFGFIQGLLTAYEIPYELVRPQKWKKEFSITADKNQAIDVCKRLFPGVELKRTDRCRNDDDNMADAALICEYARRHM